MNINRHNYETFFLLYVDKELSGADRKAVDVFVQENPDLQMELMLLQETVVKADDIVLEKKDWLFREEEISILQENLLLYADDELNTADKNTVEVLLATDEKAMTEWNILQQIKLEPDTSVVFEDKQSLYRKEAGRVVTIKWWRVAAAAVLLGFGIWTGVSVYKNNFKANDDRGQLVTAGKTNSGKIETTTAETQSAENKNPDNNPAIGAADQNQGDQSNQSGPNTTAKIVKQNTVDQKDNITVQNFSNKATDNNSQESSLEKINKRPSNKIIVAAVLPPNNSSVTVSGNDNAIVKNSLKGRISNSVNTDLSNGSTDEQTTAVIPVVYDNTTDENNKDRILYMDEEKVNRTALGGFFRKAKRILERSANIKTGDGIKVAGFEIALK
jgi:hypothetical protein